jgi:methionine sulfoxide reductase catalytic subunit
MDTNMIIKIKTSADVPSSEITPEHLYHSRREFIRLAGAGVLGVAAGPLALGGASSVLEAAQEAFANVAKSPLSTTEKPHTWEQITNYNNFYEFGTAKSDPARNSGKFTTRPWTVKVDGLVGKPADYAIDDLIKMNQLEERIYRHRCVEAWSMVIPWVGIPLATILKKVEPTSKAAFVEFTSVLRPAEMPGQRERNMNTPYPYVEGLTIQEAMHPLTLAVVGLYGKVLPNPNGAPLRIHIPWKYGFKSGKSIVRIRLTDKQPRNTWQAENADEYGFYANVNPEVDHPRWSQKTERVIGQLFQKPTVKFNGYGDQVASLYTGLDLRKNF